MSSLHFGLCGFLVVALITDIIALATPGWIYVNDPPLSFSQGLFERYQNDTISDVVMSSAEKTAAAFLIMGGVIIIAAIICAGISGMQENNKLFGKVAGVLSFIAGIFVIIGTATYSGLNAQLADQSYASFGYSFGFAWSTAILCILLGVAGVVI